MWCHFNMAGAKYTLTHPFKLRIIPELYYQFYDFVRYKSIRLFAISCVPANSLKISVYFLINPNLPDAPRNSYSK